MSGSDGVFLVGDGVMGPLDSGGESLWCSGGESLL